MYKMSREQHQSVLDSYQSNTNIMLPPSHQASDSSSRPAFSTNPPSSFGFRFQQQGQPNVYFRKEPDLTSNPNQVWVSLDTSAIKFENYTPDDMRHRLDSVSAGEEDGGDEAEVRSPKRQKTDAMVQPKATKTSSVAMGFRVDKPVQANVPSDIWRTILKESHPTVLLKAKNLNHFFHNLLQEQSIWRASRLKLHGEDMPAPPGAMTEQRYAHLLYGQGCDFQKSKCGSSVTKKVYWPFLLRMCDACYRRKTEKVCHAHTLILDVLLMTFSIQDKSLRMSTFHQIGDVDIGELVPAGMTSSGKYTRTRWCENIRWVGLVRAVYLRSDLEAISSEYQEMVQAGFLAPEIETWVAEKRAGAQTLMAQCTIVEDFQKDFTAGQPRHREARAEFFAGQAVKLTPSLGKDVMERMTAYKMSLDSNHEPTLRSWMDLKNKILPHRAAAEALIELQQQNERYRRLGQLSPAIQNFRGLHNMRFRSSPSQSLLPEQIFVIELGQRHLSSCKDRAVADTDLLLLVLRGVFEEYQQMPAAKRPKGTNADLSQGVYRLTMDDARLIVQEVVQPEVRGWDDTFRVRESLQRFKCAGCVRKDCTTRYSFDAVFQHIHEKHATYVSEGEDFHKLYRPFDGSLYNIHFPWYTVEWMRNLPVAASHHLVTKERKWLADAEIAYVPATLPASASAFSNRRAVDSPDISAEDFEGNLMYAAAKLRPTNMKVLCQMRIALRYALDRYAVTNGVTKPSLADFIACLPKLQAVNEEFNLPFSCGVCKHNPDIPQSAVHTRPETLTKLREHFVKTHQTHDWTLSFMDLPSEAQLAIILQDEDEKLKKEKRATMDRQATLFRNPRKKADPNAKMILQRPEAMAVFNELFPRTDA
jgi:hypothetical protein